MLKVKNLTLLSQKIYKKGGNFDHGWPRFFLQPSVAFWFDILTKILFSIEWK